MMNPTEEQPSVRYADFGQRLVAMIIDNFIILLLVACVFGVFFLYNYTTGHRGTPSDGFFIGLFLYYFIGIPVTASAYRTLFECSKRQATPGKIMMKMIVVDEKLERISLGRSLGRNLSKYISSFLLIGYLIALSNKQCRTLHDQIAGTNVILK